MIGGVDPQALKDRSRCRLARNRSATRPRARLETSLILRVIWSDPALAAIERVHQRIAAESLDATVRVAHALLEAGNSLGHLPYGGPPVPGTTRRELIAGFDSVSAARCSATRSESSGFGMARDAPPPVMAGSNRRSRTRPACWTLRRGWGDVWARTLQRDSLQVGRVPARPALARFS